MNSNARQAGFSLIEITVGMVVSTIVLGGAFSLWKTHQEEGHRLEKKIGLRNVMTLSSKRIQRSVTLAGLGLGRAANLAKAEAVGSDTLTIFTNPGENRCSISSNVVANGSPQIQVVTPSLFTTAKYVVLSDTILGEIRKITGRSGTTLILDSPFTRSFNAAETMAYPASRERFYTNQSSKQLMRDDGGTIRVMAQDVKDFKVSFHNSLGQSTNVTKEVRTVIFSITGIFPAKAGALNQIVLSSTAIPRNTL